METTAFHPANACGFHLRRLIDGLLDASVNRCAQPAVQDESFQRYLHHCAARPRWLGAARFSPSATPRGRRKAVRHCNSKPNKALKRRLKKLSKLHQSASLLVMEEIHRGDVVADSMSGVTTHARPS